jgi:autotransporter-associated beta strand protein
MYVSTLRKTLLALICLAVTGTASAGTITTWSGGGGNNSWSTSGNWVSGSPPTVSATTYSLVYRGSPTQKTSQNNLNGPVLVDSILFDNNGGTGSNTAFLLSRSGTASLSLTNGANVTTTASSLTISDTISSLIRLQGTGTFNLGTSHNVVLSGSLTGAGSIVKTGAGELQLSGSNDLLSLKIDQGIVQVNAAAFSNISGQTIEIGSSGQSGGLRLYGVGAAGAPVSTATQFKMNGSGNVAGNNSSSANFTASQFNVANAAVITPTTLTLNGGGAGSKGTMQIQGVIQDNSSLGTVGVTISGANVWELAAVNTYTGATTVSASGQLFLTGKINAASAVTSNGLIAGSGTFGGDVTILSGTLSPGGVSLGAGAISEGIGALTMRALTLGSSATTELTITGSTSDLYDQVIGSTTLTWGGTIALTIGDGLVTSYDDWTTFNLFTGFASTSGNLAGITLNAAGTDFAGMTFYQGTDGDWYTGWDGVNGAVASGWNAAGQELKFSQSTGTLTVVPEPSTIVFAGIGMAMFGWSTLTRRRAKARRQAIEASIA